MITQELSNYIREALRRKMSFETIQSELLRVGWEQSDILRCYDMVHNELFPPTGESTHNPPGTTPPSSSLQQVVQTQPTPADTAITHVPVTNLESVYVKPKKRGSFGSIFMIVSIFVLIVLAVLTYRGFFVDTTHLVQGLSKAFNQENALLVDFEISFFEEQEMGNTPTTIRLNGTYSTTPDQAVYSIVQQEDNTARAIDIGIQSIDGIVYVQTNNLPESSFSELSIYEGQWFRIPFTNTIRDTFTLEGFEIPTSFKEIVTILSNPSSLEALRELSEGELLTITKKEPLVFIDRMPHYLVHATLEREALETLVAGLEQANKPFIIENSILLENLRNIKPEMLTIRVMMGVLDSEIKTIEIMYQDGSLVSAKGTFEFVKKSTLSNPTTPPSSYTIDEFIEKARSGLIPNLMLNGVPYAEYIQNTLAEQQAEIIRSEHREVLSKIIEEDISSTYFLGNKKSFVGICKTVSLENGRICREARNGFIVYAPIVSLPDTVSEYLCVDAYTKGSYSVLSSAPTTLRCN